MAFVGNNESSPVYTEPVKESPPPYEDTGVRYQGYSKYQITGGQFGLKYQRKFNSYITINNTATVQSAGIIGINRVFVTDLIMAFVDTGGIATTTTRRLTLGRMEALSGSFAEESHSIPVFKPVDTSATGVGTSGNTIVLHFNTPLEIQGKTENSVLGVRALDSGCYMGVTIIGFIEA